LKNLIKFVIPFVLLVTYFGCSKDKTNNPVVPNNSFRIVCTVNGLESTLSGSVTFTVTNDSAVVGVFRIVEPAAATHNLTGFYIDTTNVLLAAGDGYNFSGHLADSSGLFLGSVTGAANGLVIGARDNNNSSVAFCGAYTGDDQGTWNFTIQNTSFWGSYTSIGNVNGVLMGTISGDTITLYEDSDQVATGIRNGNNVSGTWQNGGGGGAWTGSRCN
jgi:hypothetical protein